MRRTDRMDLRFQHGTAIATACLGTVLALAQVPAQAAGQTASALIPLAHKGPGSLTGVWNDAGSDRKATTADGQPIPYQPETAKALAQRMQRANGKLPDDRSDPECVPSGMPVMMDPPPGLPLQILETSRQVTVLFGSFGTFRIIHMNEKHADDPDPSYFGNSVGHWEGNTLVVDTIGLTDKTTLFGAAHSEDMHLVERIHRVDEQTLEDRVTITDSKAYTRPWTWVITLKQLPGTNLKEYQRHPC